MTSRAVPPPTAKAAARQATASHGRRRLVSPSDAFITAASCRVTSSRGSVESEAAGSHSPRSAAPSGTVFLLNPPQLAEQFVRRLPAAGKVLGEHLVNDAAQGRRQVGAKRLQRLRLLLQVLHGHAQRRLAHERRIAGQHLVTRRPEGIDVAAGVQRLALDLLGAHVQRRAHGHPRPGQIEAFGVAGEAGETEIGDFDFAGVGEHDVFRLDVAVDDAFVGGLRQRRGGLPHDRQRPAQFRRPMPGEPLAEVQAADVFLDDVVQSVAVAHLVNLHDVGVDQGRRRLRLALEALQIRGIIGEFGLKDFDGDAAIQQALLAEIDLGHRSPPHAPQHLHVAQRPAGEIGHRLGGITVRIGHLTSPRGATDAPQRDGGRGEKAKLL